MPAGVLGVLSFLSLVTRSARSFVRLNSSTPFNRTYRCTYKGAVITYVITVPFQVLFFSPSFGIRYTSYTSYLTQSFRITLSSGPRIRSLRSLNARLRVLPPSYPASPSLVGRGISGGTTLVPRVGTSIVSFALRSGVQTLFVARFALSSLACFLY